MGCKRGRTEELSQFPYKPEAGEGEREEGGRVIRDGGSEDVKKIIISQSNSK